MQSLSLCLKRYFLARHHVDGIIKPGVERKARRNQPDLFGEPVYIGANQRRFLTAFKRQGSDPNQFFLYTFSRR